MEERRRFILFADVPVVNSYGVGGPRSLFNPLDAFGRFVWCIDDVFLYYLYDFKHVMVIFTCVYWVFISALCTCVTAVRGYIFSL